MIVVVHGYEGSGPGHWQRWLVDALRARGVEVRFPALPDDLAPQRAEWVAELAAIVRGRGAAEVTFVAHSLGCWAVDHYVATHGAEGVRAALLVAPPSPYSLFEPIQSFLPPPRDPAAWRPLAGRTRIVGSDDDPYADAREIEALGRTLGVAVRILPGAGHVNAAAGFGPFPLTLEWLTEVGALA